MSRGVEQAFVHLRVHSAYSLSEGALKIDRLVGLAKADGQPAVALTDTNNLFGALEFSEKAKAKGVQPIVGLSLSLDLGDAPDRNGRPKPMPAIALLAADEAGYRNLMALATHAYLSKEDEEAPHSDWETLRRHSKGVLALAGGPCGPLDTALRDGREEEAADRLETLLSIYGDSLWMELQRHSGAKHAKVEPWLVERAFARGIPIVATNQCYFPESGDYEAHDALRCIANAEFVGDERRARLPETHHFRSRAEMGELFADLPEALEQTIEIARQCAYRPLKRSPLLPRFTGGAGADAEAAENAEAQALRDQAAAGLEERLRTRGLVAGKDRKEYEDRLAYELDVIEKMKFPGYFLIVSDFIKWAKAQGIPVGPGRGSGAGSLVAYSLMITDLDPLQFDLLFERFLNPERVSMPDFDIDFCQERRDEVIAYVRGRYGHDQVAAIITFGTLQARAVLRDVGRVLEMPFRQVDGLCKLVPFVPTNPKTLQQSIDEEPRLKAERDRDPHVRRLMDIALKLEGLHRHASTHAAGVVIGDRPLHELVALFRDPRSPMPATQFNMKWVESAGLVKFDFLGLKTLTVVQHAVNLIQEKGDAAFDINAIPLDDPAAYKIMADAETTGVFQLESVGMRRALADMQPDRFEDIIAAVSLYRPGPMANIPTYCARKRGDEEVDVLHPKLKDILGPTYGIIVYQEQVMQIAQVLAGYSLAEADLLRRAMGKKIRAEMEAQRARFVEGAVARDVDAGQASMIFDLVAKFAEYGFNKSHAACYALIAYQTAWLKAHHPRELFCALMTYDQGNTDKLGEFVRDAREKGINVRPPCVNEGQAVFAPWPESEPQRTDGEPSIAYSLAAVKGVGENVVAEIVKARGGKRFESLSDFVGRMPAKVVNKRSMECLAAAGAFDGLEKNRRAILDGIEVLMREMNQSGAQDGGMFGELIVAAKVKLPKSAPFTMYEKMDAEHRALGFYVSDHPLAHDAQLIARLGTVSCSALKSELIESGSAHSRMAVVIHSRRELRTKAGKRMGIFCFSDATGQCEATVFSETLQQYDDLLVQDAKLILDVEGEWRPEGARITILRAQILSRAATRKRCDLVIHLRQPAELSAVSAEMPGPGSNAIHITVPTKDRRSVRISLGAQFAVTDETVRSLRRYPREILTVDEIYS